MRVVAATNVNLRYAVSRGKFREDLYYRLNAVSVLMPALRDRKDDIHLLFRKFASDFAAKYNMVKVSLTEEAVNLLRSYRWPGNIRQLKNVAETVSAIESVKSTPGSEKREINAATLAKYLPKEDPNLLPVKADAADESFSSSEKEMLVRTIFQLRQDVDYLKSIVMGNGAPVRGNVSERSLIGDDVNIRPSAANAGTRGGDDTVMTDIYAGREDPDEQPARVMPKGQGSEPRHEQDMADMNPANDLSIEKTELALIKLALDKYKGNRKLAAEELGISERTLYRKLKSLDKE